MPIKFIKDRLSPLSEVNVQNSKQAEYLKPVTDIFLLSASGFSMWPFLRPADRLIVKRISLTNIRIGDIILYEKDSQLVCHRVIKKARFKDKYLLYIRGDNSKSIEIIDGNAFKGKVISILRKKQFKNLTTGYQPLVNHFIAVFNPFIRGSFRIAKFFLKKGDENEQ